MAAKVDDKVYGRLFEQKCFSRSLKVASDCEVTTSAGRLFHFARPHTKPFTFYFSLVISCLRKN